MIFLVHSPRTGGNFLLTSLRHLGVEITATHDFNWRNRVPDGASVWTIIREPWRRARSMLRVTSELPRLKKLFSRFEAECGMTERIKDGVDIDVVLNTSDLENLLNPYNIPPTSIMRDQFGSIRGDCSEQSGYDFSQDQVLFERLTVGCCGKPPIATLINGARGIAKAVTGADRADNGTIQKRRAICRACEHAKRCHHNVSLFCTCKLCGCSLKAKTLIASESCPINLW